MIRSRMHPRMPLIILDFFFLISGHSKKNGKFLVITYHLLIYSYKYIFMFFYVYVCEIVSVCMCVSILQKIHHSFFFFFPPSITDASSFKKQCINLCVMRPITFNTKQLLEITLLIGCNYRAPGGDGGRGGA